MKKIYTIIITLALILFISSSAFAIPASPGIFSVETPDGQKMSVRIFGDEHTNWYETLDGYAIQRNPSGAFEYSVQDDTGLLVPSGFLLGDTPPPLRKHLKPSRAATANLMSRANNIRAAATPSATVQVSGSQKVLVILIKYPDIEPDALHTTAYFDALYYGDTSGNVNHYLKEISYNQLSITGAASNWYISAQNSTYYADLSGLGSGLARELVQEAVIAADPDIDFSQYDNDGDGYVDHLSIVHSGGDAAQGAVNIWSHSWALATPYATGDGVSVWKYVINSEDRILGTHAHELMHSFGAPDLYDVSYGGEVPVGSWCIMGYGAFGGSPSGSVPTHPCGYLKSDIDADETNGYAGWVGMTNLSQNGTYTLSHIESPVASLGAERLYRVDIPSDNEYFVLENRQAVGYDVSLPETGIVIYHIDTDMPDSTYYVNDSFNTYFRAVTEDTSSSYGKSGAAFSANDNQMAFSTSTTPNTNSNNGAVSAIAISAISATSADMFFSLELAEVPNVAPTANLIASPITGEAPLSVAFAGAGTDTDGNIVSYHYSFGDGEISTESTPTHIFTTVGTYTVTFTVTDNDGDSGIQTIVITVTEPVEEDSGGGGGGGCGLPTMGDSNFTPPSLGQIIFDMMLLMLPMLIVISRKRFSTVKYR
ncbi:M6 family metalloprotease domain-containing protein [Thermodesulfobacteriota bacterium]